MQYLYAILTLVLGLASQSELEAYDTISFSFKNNINNVEVSVSNFQDQPGSFPLTTLFTPAFTTKQGSEFCFNINMKATTGSFSTIRHVCYRFSPSASASYLCLPTIDKAFGSLVYENDAGCIDCLAQLPICIYKSFPSGLQQIQVKFE